MKSEANPIEVEGDFNLVEIWTRIDLARWIAGALAGAVAGGIALIVGIVLSKAGGYEPLYAVKVAAIPFLGAKATEYGNGQAVIVGFAAFEILTTIFGIIYAHFTGTNNRMALFGVGLAWAGFSWVFWANLFSRSWREIYVLQIPSSATLFVCLAYGLGLMTVGYFDPVIRKALKK